ncbi:MAG: hypothetical protein KDB05_21375 [Planctomycetales bacterium]|nr:hypothetical protein [Planctomycetales bacterium]
MYKSFSALLIAFAISTPAHAEIFGFLSSNGGPEQVVDGHVYAPTQSTVVDGSMHGYPFYSGCCEQKSSCCQGLWDGYCGSKGCGMHSCRLGYRGHLKGGCGCDTGVAMGYGHSSCGKGGCGMGGCGYPAPCGSKFGWGHMSHRGLGGKGGCGGCGSKGCDTCDPCAPKHHCRLGLFDWLHFGHGHGCGVCGGVGCSSCSGGKGGYGKGGYGKGGYIEYAPTQGYGESYYGTPTEAQEESSLQPPEVLVEPTSISDRSARRRPVPANSFARPYGF